MIENDVVRTLASDAGGEAARQPRSALRRVLPAAGLGLVLLATPMVTHPQALADEAGAQASSTQSIETSLTPGGSSAQQAAGSGSADNGSAKASAAASATAGVTRATDAAGTSTGGAAAAAALGSSASAQGSGSQAKTQASVEMTDAQAQQSGFTYALDAQNTVTILTYSGTATQVSVPSSIDGHAVTAVAASAFANNATLTSVTLPASVTQIGDAAFSGCTSLAQVTLPASLQWLGAGAFSGCTSLVEVELPSTLVACGTTWSDQTPQGPFAGCTKLADVTVAEGAVTLPPFMLAGLDGLQTLTLPDSIASVDVTVFGNTGNPPAQLTIRANQGTAAQKFAEQYGLAFEDLSIPATSVTVSQTQASVFRGTSLQLKATVLPADTTDVLTWESSDTKVATVTQDGTVKAVGAGSATITAKAGSVQATCELTVTIPVESITLNRASFEIEAGETRQMVTTVKPDDATEKGVEWTSSNPAVATVSADGTVKGVAKGTATLTAKAIDGSGVTATCKVEVISDIHVVDKPSGIATAHEYANDCLDQWVYTLAGAEALDVTFDANTAVENSFDFIEIYDAWGGLVGSYTGGELAGATVRVGGDTVTVKLVSDGQTTGWGFAVKDVTAVQLNGWTVIDGVTYYLEGGSFAKGERQIDGNWYYFNEYTGAMVTGFVRMSDGRLVYYDANGVRLHGDVWLADGWHYFDPYDGRMCIGAVHRPGGWYYYDINGVRCTGPIIINGTTYYFNTYTGVMVTEQTYVDIDIDNTTNIDIDNIVVNDTDIDINDGDVADDEKDDAAVLSAYMDILTSGSYLEHVTDTTSEVAWIYTLLDINGDGVSELLVLGMDGNGVEADNIDDTVVYTYDTAARQAVLVQDLYGYAPEGLLYSAEHKALVFAEKAPSDDSASYSFLQLDGTTFVTAFAISHEGGAWYYAQGDQRTEITKNEFDAYLATATELDYQTAPVLGDPADEEQPEESEQPTEGEQPEESQQADESATSDEADGSDDADEPDGADQSFAADEPQGPSSSAQADEPAGEPSDAEEPAEESTDGEVSRAEEPAAPDASAEGDQPADSQQADEPASSQQTDEPVAEEPAVEDQPAASSEADQSQSSDQPAEEQPASSEQPEQTQPADEQPGPEEQPAPEQSQPADEPSQPAESQPADQPSESAPAQESQPADEPSSSDAGEQASATDPLIGRTDSSTWGYAVSDAYHVTTNYVDFDIPAYWQGKVDLVVASREDGTEALSVTPTAAPGYTLATFTVAPTTGTESDNPGNVENQLIGTWDLGNGTTVSLWAPDWATILTGSDYASLAPLGAGAQVISDLAFAGGEPGAGTAVVTAQLAPSVSVSEKVAQAQTEPAADEAPAEEPAPAPAEQTPAPEATTPAEETPADPGATAPETPAEQVPVSETTPSEGEPAVEEGTPAAEAPAPEASAPSDQATDAQQPSAEEAPAPEEGAAPEVAATPEETPAPEETAVPEEAPAEAEAPAESTPADEATTSETPAPAEGEPTPEAPAESAEPAQETAPAEEGVPAETTPAEEQPAPAEPVASELTAEQSDRLRCLTASYLRAALGVSGSDLTALATPNAEGNLVADPAAFPALDASLLSVVLGGSDTAGPVTYMETAATSANPANPLGFDISDDGVTIYVPLATGTQVLASVFGTSPADPSIVGSDTVVFTGDGWQITKVSEPQNHQSVWMANHQLVDGVASFDVAMLFVSDQGAPTLRFFHVEAVQDEASSFGFHLSKVTETADPGLFPEAQEAYAAASM